MLLALDLKLPDTLLIHGFVNVDGTKMSKSLGNVVSPLEIIENYGADAFRYYFSRHVPTFDDGDFTWEKFEAAYNGELANDLGNLVSRTAQMIKKYCGGLVPNGKYRDGFVPSESEETIFDKAVHNFDFTEAFDSIWRGLQDNNRYIDDRKPWAIAKNIDGGDVVEKVNQFRDKTWPITDEVFNGTSEEFDAQNPAQSLYVILWNLAESLRNVAENLEPFLPETAAKIREIFGGEKLPDEIPILFPKKYLQSEEPTRK
jgi:methionyl-tRNA synthetase